MFGWRVAGRTENGHGKDSVRWGGALLKGQKMDMVRTVYVGVKCR